MTWDFQDLGDIAYWLLNESLSGVVYLAIIFLALRLFFSSYLKQKASNLATKEDVASITREVEGVKSEYTRILEEVKKDNQLVISAVNREKSLKQEVYMEAVEALTEGLSIFSYFLNLEVEDRLLSDKVAKVTGAIAKVQAIGSRDVFEDVCEFSSSFSNIILELSLERSGLKDRKNRIEEVESTRNNHQKNVDECVSYSKRLSVEGKLTKKVAEYIQNEFESSRSSITELNNTIDELWRNQREEGSMFLNHTMDKYFEVCKHIPELNFSMREDLGLFVDKDGFMNRYNLYLDKSKESVENYFRKIKDIWGLK